MIATDEGVAAPRARTVRVCTATGKNCIETDECQKHMLTYADYRRAKRPQDMFADEAEERAFLESPCVWSAQWCPHREHRSLTLQRRAWF